MYTPWRRAKRWWFSIILGFIHIAVSNAWVLYRWHVPEGEQDLSTFAQWTDKLAIELIGHAPGKRRQSEMSALNHHTFVHMYSPDKPDTPKQQRCSVCAKRVITTVVIHGKVQRKEKQTGAQSTWFCRECSRLCVRGIPVCKAAACRFYHALHPPQPSIFGAAE